MIRIKSVAYTGYSVTDMPRARGFYEGILGLQSSTTYENEGQAWIEYDIGPATLAVTNMASEWKPSSDGPMIVFEVDDFAAAVETFRAKSVRFALEPTETPVCYFATVLDPDGNAVAIHHKKVS